MEQLLLGRVYFDIKLLLSLSENELLLFVLILSFMSSHSEAAEALIFSCSSSRSTGCRSQSSYSTSGCLWQRSVLEKDQFGLLGFPKWWLGYCVNYPNGKLMGKRKLPRFQRETDEKAQVDCLRLNSGFVWSLDQWRFWTGWLSWQKVWSQSLADLEKLGRVGVLSFIDNFIKGM